MAEQKEKLKLDKAVAIKYDAETDNAPVITAIGVGQTAEKIKELANEHDIPMYEDRNLVEVLGHMDIGEEIPTELYAVMAEILAWVYQLEKGIE